MPEYYYPDIAFLANFFLDYILLFLTGRIRRLQMGWGRICFSAAVGSLTAVLITLYGAGRGFRAAGTLLGSALMCVAAFGRRGIKGNIAALFFCTFIMGGMLYGVGSFLFGASIKNRTGAGGQSIVPAAVLLALFTVLIAGVILFAARARREAVNTPVYQVRFLIGDGDAPYCCRGFLDTGNGLYEPFGKKPVLLLVSPEYKAVLEEFLVKSPEKTRYIPYRAIGHSDGMLLGAELKELVILRGQEEIHLTGIPAAYTEISGRGDAYQVILHPDFFP